MATETNRVSLMRDALTYLCGKYATKREGDLAEADYYTPPEYGSALCPQAMRLRARAAVLADVLRDLRDIIHDPIYGPIVILEESKD